MARRPQLASELLPPDAKLPGEASQDLPDMDDGNSAAINPDDLGEAEEQEDGSEFYPLGDDESAEEESGPTDADGNAIDLEVFFENLVEDPKILQSITAQAKELLDQIEQDIEDRKDRDDQQDEGIRRTGLGKDAPGGADFNGASKAVHPVLAEGCVDFGSRMIKELFPPSGPVKVHLEGKATKEKMARAERKQKHMNWQLTQQIREYRHELEQTCTQLPLGGSQYMQWWYENGRPHCEFVPIDYVIMPFAASSFDTAERVTVLSEITDMENARRTSTGMYIEANESAMGSLVQETASEQSSHKIEGKERSGIDLDGGRRIFTSYCWLEVEDDVETKGELAPYILVMEQDTGAVRALRRNWDPTIQSRGGRQRMDWLVQFDFIPWRGAVAVGLPHLIGSLSGAITGGVRALLDSAHINNAATLLKLKGANIGGQSTNVEVTQVAEIEGPTGVDDIRKVAMPMPFNPPSVVLFDLVKFMISEAKGVVATAEDKIADATSNAPVGTVLAQIEQGSISFSAIHARGHDAQRRSFEILHRINKFWLDDEEVLDDLGEMVVRREDYEGAMDIIPVSDPNIFSETQRITQVQAAMDLNKMFPGLMDQRALLKRGLQVIKIPDMEELLPEPEKPSPENPVMENVKMFMGQHAWAFPDQEHEAHMQVHLAFFMDPNFGSSPAWQGNLVTVWLEHMKQHFGFWYANQAVQIVSQQVGYDISSLDFSDPESQNALARALAAASPQVMQASQQTFQQVSPVIQKALEVVSQLQQMQMQMMNPPQPPDPAAMAEVQRRAQRDQGDLALKAKDQQLRASETQARLANDAQRTQAAREATAQRDRADRNKLIVEQALIELERDANLRGERLDTAKLRADLAQLQQTHLQHIDDNELAWNIALLKARNEQQRTASTNQSAERRTGAQLRSQERQSFATVMAQREQHARQLEHDADQATMDRGLQRQQMQQQQVNDGDNDGE